MLVCNDEKLFKNLIVSDIEKYTRNSKKLFAYADKNSVETKNLCFDVELAAYLL